MLSTAASSRLSALFSYPVNLLDIFQSHKSYGEVQWKRVLKNVNLQSWPWDRLLKDSCTSGKHLFEFAMLLILAQMFYVWKEWTGHAVRQW